MVELIKWLEWHTVVPPEGYSTKELCAWMNGYAQCQKEILDFIAEVTGYGKNDTSIHSDTD